MAKIAFLGLGVMGYPMAGHLVTAGHNVTVYNRTISKAKKWISEFSGVMAETPSVAVKNADFVMSCVGNDRDLLDITVGESGAFSQMKKGSVFIDHTTVSAKVTEELYQKSQTLGINFVDAPISGGQTGAEKGVLSIMCGGDGTDYARVEQIFEYTSNIGSTRA
jgi:3-hydroxyisobutyrate dehydrogenase